MCALKTLYAKENEEETRDIKWVSLPRLRKIVQEKPEKIFGLSLAVLKSYLEMKK